MDDLVQELAALIKSKSHNGKAHVVGHSYGGVVAQALISGAPEVVESAILSGTSARLSPFMTGSFKVYLKLNEPILRLLRPEQLGKLLAFQFGIPAQYTRMLGDDMKRMDPGLMVQVLMQSYLDIRTPADTINTGAGGGWKQRNAFRQVHGAQPGKADPRSQRHHSARVGARVESAESACCSPRSYAHG